MPYHLLYKISVTCVLGGSALLLSSCALDQLDPSQVAGIASGMASAASGAPLATSMAAASAASNGEISAGDAPAPETTAPRSPTVQSNSSGQPQSSATANSSSASTESANYLVAKCQQGNAYKHWMSICSNDPTAQAACHCAAAALYRCCIDSAPSDPDVGSWKQAYAQEVQSAQALNGQCFSN